MPLASVAEELLPRIEASGVADAAIDAEFKGLKLTYISSLQHLRKEYKL